MNHGADGQPGVNRYNGKIIGAKQSFHVKAGDSVCIETPGGGGCGREVRSTSRNEKWKMKNEKF